MYIVYCMCILGGVGGLRFRS